MSKWLICIVLTACTACPVLAQPAEETGPATPAAPERRGPAPTLSDVSYGPHARNVLDFWKAPGDEPTPVLISIHGGGFMKGQKSVRTALLGRCLESGISVVAISYRLSSDAIAPAPFHDGARAVQFVRSKARQWGLDPSRIVLTGGSAGAGISLWVAFHDDLGKPDSEDPIERQSTRVSGVVTFDGQCSYDPRFIRQIIPGDAHSKTAALPKLFGIDINQIDNLPPEKYQLMEECAPINHVTRDDPPALLLYAGSEDPEEAVKSSGAGIHHPLFGKALKQKMEPLGLRCEVYSKDSNLPDQHAKAMEFIREVLKVAPPAPPARRGAAQ